MPCGRKKDEPPIPGYSSLIKSLFLSWPELRELFSKLDRFMLDLNVMLARYKPLPMGDRAHTVSFKWGGGYLCNVAVHA